MPKLMASIIRQGLIVVQNWDTGGVCAWGVITPTRSVRSWFFLRYRSVPVHGRPISVGGRHLTADPGPPSVTGDHHAAPLGGMGPQTDQLSRPAVPLLHRRGDQMGF